ncbi:class I SAM-dependent methyltransferase [Zhihengliuella halotolerans]|uniref:16S rRNA m(2)G 1207 methyltransferase n=1 Tax=Zhihengliuella halotolerans TaxID=370736 RepID=A0A4Q8AE67_9MICC|nr:methyltransferase [Zhihengliuella halotolerans]RZU61859.1 16S rRNA m(2)G 1207 methyltransferase [Zhihengliuella halotolerans]
MGSEHYFSAQPATPEQRRTITVELAGSERRVETAGGIFSPDGLDKGTAVLLAGVPAPSSSGHLLDLGCGWGPIALTLGLASPDATVHAVDVNERSIALTRDNAAALGLTNVVAGRPETIAADVAFDTIWSNPPIRIGKQALHELLLTWLPRLAPGGTAWLVVQKNLGADSLLTWLNRELPDDLTTVRESTAKSFRVLKVQRAD